MGSGLLLYETGFGRMLCALVRPEPCAGVTGLLV